MVRDKYRRDVLEQRAKEERARLSKLHLITTEELKQALSEIDCQSLSSKKKCEKKHSLIREQLNIRKKLLKQTIKLPFTHKGRQRPMKDIIVEFNSDEGSLPESSCECSPESLIGREILHRFEVEDKKKWYAGHVVSYNAVTHLHEVAYDEEEETLKKNLLEDLSNGDIIKYYTCMFVINNCDQSFLSSLPFRRCFV